MTLRVILLSASVGIQSKLLKCGLHVQMSQSKLLELGQHHLHPHLPVQHVWKVPFVAIVHHARQINLVHVRIAGILSLGMLLAHQRFHALAMMMTRAMQKTGTLVMTVQLAGRLAVQPVGRKEQCSLACVESRMM